MSPEKAKELVIATLKEVYGENVETLSTVVWRTLISTLCEIKMSLPEAAEYLINGDYSDSNISSIIEEQKEYRPFFLDYQEILKIFPKCKHFGWYTYSV